MKNILIIRAAWQIGSELPGELRKIYGYQQIFAAESRQITMNFQAVLVDVVSFQFNLSNVWNFLSDKFVENIYPSKERFLKIVIVINVLKSNVNGFVLYFMNRMLEFSAQFLLKKSRIFGFFYPVVPKEQANISVRISAAREREYEDKAVKALYL